MRMLTRPVVRTGGILAPRKEYTRPPANPSPPNENGDFVYKVVTYQIDSNDDKMKKFVGYDTDIDILPKTISFCKQCARNNEICSQPTIGTSNDCKMAGMVIVTNYQTGTSYPHFV